MGSDHDYDTMYSRSRLPDPCTLLFGVPRQAPPPVDDRGRQWTVAHWINCARRAAGHLATPIPGGEPTATYCGDIDLDGMTYRVHRGPRRRTLVEIIDEQDRPAWRFELEETVWVEPVEPEPLEVGQCLWCDFGAPDTFRLAGESDEDNVYVIAVAEHADGGGRVLSISFNPDEDDVDAGLDTYCLVLDPGQHTYYGGIIECILDHQQLQLRLTAEAATTLGIDPILRSQLDLEPAQLVLLRAGLQRTLSAGRPDARPHRLQVT